MKKQNKIKKIIDMKKLISIAAFAMVLMISLTSATLKNHCVTEGFSPGIAAESTCNMSFQDLSLVEIGDRCIICNPCMAHAVFYADTCFVKNDIETNTHTYAFNPDRWVCKDLITEVCARCRIYDSDALKLSLYKRNHDSKTTKIYQTLTINSYNPCTEYNLLL